MRKFKLGPETVLQTGFNYKWVLTYADITAAAGASDTSIAIPLLPFTSGKTFPAGTCVHRVAMNLITAFDASGDASINSLLFEVGDGTDPNRFIGQTQVAVDGTEILFDAGAVSTRPYAYLAADTLDVTFTVAGGSDPTLDELTSGELEIYAFITDLNDLEVVDS